MQPSEEIRRVIDRWLVAARDGDVETYGARFSAQPGTLGIGTDDDEWFHVAEMPVWIRQVEQIGGFPIAWDEIEAWEDGVIGWGAAKMTMQTIAGETPRMLRLSFIVRLERGDWKIIQAHWSLGIPNADVLGIDLPTSLEQLGAAIRQDRPDLSASTGSDGTVTLVFTDIVDSTVLTARVGDRAWMETIRRHREVLADIVSRYDGRVVETQGDGSLLAFASARRAVACGIAIQTAIREAFIGHSPPIRLRIGIHTGDVIQEEDAFYGTTVNYAARVASHALGGEVLVSRLVHDLVADTGVSFLESREVELKGIDGTHRLYAATTP